MNATNATITTVEPYIHACVLGETPNVGRNDGRKPELLLASLSASAVELLPPPLARPDGARPDGAEPAAVFCYFRCKYGTWEQLT